MANRDFACCCVVYVVLILNLISQRSEAFGTYGFDIHHRYSDPVKGILDLEDLPEKGSRDYYTLMGNRDRIVHGRRLSGSRNSTHYLAFSNGNHTYRINSLAFLHYANVTVGTPGLSFLVPLDTGSNLFWLPCDCGSSCITGTLRTEFGQIDHLSIYDPKTSSTSKNVSCSDRLCRTRRQCSALTDACPYEVAYLEADTSSSGTLVQDVLHLVTDDNSDFDMVRAPIKFGCARIQTGAFRLDAGINGLFGLGMGNISVPSILASEGFVSNSFSMCFSRDGIGRIRFGDEGTFDQKQTPFDVDKLFPRYNVRIQQISVGDNVTDIHFNADFDSGTSFTYLTEPSYSAITESFDSQIADKRRTDYHNLPFEYCYDIKPDKNINELQVPVLNLKMRGGRRFTVNDPIVIFALQAPGNIYCLAIDKSEDINIIGQNFMTGYHIVFDREKMILGWKASDCYGGSGKQTVPAKPRKSTAVPTPTASPEASPGNTYGSPWASHSSPGPSSVSTSSAYSTSTVLFALTMFAAFYFPRR